LFATVLELGVITLVVGVYASFGGEEGLEDLGGVSGGEGFGVGAEDGTAFGGEICGLRSEKGGACFFFIGS